MKHLSLFISLFLFGQLASAQIPQSESLQACEELVASVQAKNKVQGFACEKGVERPFMYVVLLKGQDGNLVGAPKPIDELTQIQCYKPYIKKLIKQFDAKFVYRDGEVLVTESICARQ
jgi:hypothetical protein